ncbi:MAG: hypothetical protein V3T22_08060 [Planctomycetota bacterium]
MDRPIRILRSAAGVRTVPAEQGPLHRQAGADREEQGLPIPVALGLALTRIVVQRHAGTVEVSCSPSGGARFQVVLPRNPGNGEESGE